VTEPGPEERPAGPTYAETAPHPRPPTPRVAARPSWRPSNLTLRLLTAAILVPPVLWICFLGGLPFVLVVTLFIAIGVNEFYDFISAKGARPHRLLGSVAAAALPLVIYLGSPFVATTFMTGVLLTVMILQLTKAEVTEAIASVSATFFGVFYVGWLLAHAVSVRFIHLQVEAYGGAADPQAGFFYMVFCLAAAVLCDAGAYFVGRRFGRHKLAPAISPNKTVEGAIGGLLVGALGAVGIKLFFDAFVPGDLGRDLNWGLAASFGVVIAAVSIVGDLVESVLKRDADLKDAGQILPGVGGVLDRIDSALIAIPVTYYLLLGHYYSMYAF
jgi:phosphatidate cytidylyltransferase